jgi:hypothetical protein
MKAHSDPVKISLKKLAVQKQSKALSRPREDDKLQLQTPAFTEAISIVPDQDFRLACSTNRNIAGVAFSYFGIKL